MPGKRRSMVASGMCGVIKVNQDLVDILNLWKQEHVFRGTIEERTEKFKLLHSLVNRLYNKQTALRIGTITPKTEAHAGSSYNSFYDRIQDSITLNGRLSVITYLHEYGHALGMGEVQAQEFAWTHFKQCFPKSASRLQRKGAMFVKE